MGGPPEGGATRRPPDTDPGEGMACRSGHGHTPPISQVEGGEWGDRVRSHRREGTEPRASGWRGRSHRDTPAQGRSLPLSGSRGGTQAVFDGRGPSRSCRCGTGRMGGTHFLEIDGQGRQVASSDDDGLRVGSLPGMCRLTAPGRPLGLEKRWVGTMADPRVKHRGVEGGGRAKIFVA